VQETESLFLVFRQLTVVGADGFEQAEAADDIGLDEVLGTMNATVDMRFGGKMQHRPGPVFGEQAGQQFAIADIAVHEPVAGIAVQSGQILTVAGISQRVEIEHRLVALRQPVEDKIAADEAGTARHQNHSPLPQSLRRRQKLAKRGRPFAVSSRKR